MNNLIKEKEGLSDGKKVVQVFEMTKNSSSVTFYGEGKVYSTTTRTVDYREHIETTKFR